MAHSDSVHQPRKPDRWAASFVAFRRHSCSDQHSRRSKNPSIFLAEATRIFDMHRHQTTSLLRSCGCGRACDRRSGSGIHLRCTRPSRTSIMTTPHRLAISNIRLASEA